MQPPVQLLSAPRAFVRALSLPQASLAQHLLLLRQSVSSLQLAQQLAQRYTGVLLDASVWQLLMHVEDVRQMLDLPQVCGVGTLEALAGQLAGAACDNWHVCISHSGVSACLLSAFPCVRFAPQWVIFACLRTCPCMFMFMVMVMPIHVAYQQLLRACLCRTLLWSCCCATPAQPVPQNSWHTYLP
jgi:hypothetical protein